MTVVMMTWGVAAAAIVGLLVSPADGFAAEKFQKLGGSQIRAKFVGMEMTDNVHWADVFGPNGSLKSYSMGRKKDSKWWIEKDELCIDRGKDDGGCYEVWLSGKNVELRRAGLPAESEGILQKPAPAIDLSRFTRVCQMKTKAKTIQILVLGGALFAAPDTLAVQTSIGKDGLA